MSQESNNIAQEASIIPESSRSEKLLMGLAAAAIISFSASSIKLMLTFIKLCRYNHHCGSQMQFK